MEMNFTTGQGKEDIFTLATSDMTYKIGELQRSGSENKKTMILSSH